MKLTRRNHLDVRAAALSSDSEDDADSRPEMKRHLGKQESPPAGSMRPLEDVARAAAVTAAQAKGLCRMLRQCCGCHPRLICRQ